jgi:threonine/homoserine/homoserine lactone efflux protein
MNPEFIAAATLIELTPGPNMAWLALLGASRGRAPALASVAGIALGLAVAGAVAAVGAATLLTAEPWLFQALRIAGSAYLLYLAYDAWRASMKDPAGGLDQPMGHFFRQGLFSNVINPKAYLFYAAVLPQFVDATRDIGPQLWTLTAVYVAIATAIHAAVVIFAGSLNALLSKLSWRMITGRVFAGLLIAVAVWFYISTGKPA